MLTVGDIHIEVENNTVTVYHGDVPSGYSNDPDSSGDAYVATYDDHASALAAVQELAWKFTTEYADRETILKRLFGEPVGGY